MIQKVSGKSDLDNTKITSIINYRGGDFTDATRIYRKEEILKKKLKVLLDNNAALEKQIKIHQTQIKDQRASVLFQLNDLIKQMSGKLGHFTEQKLEINRFNNNEIAHRTMQKMMQTYQQIQKESKMMGRMFDSIKKIQSNYKQHAKDMDDMVIDLETVNMQYQTSMEDNLHKIREQIRFQTQQNEDIQDRTQNLIREIDEYVSGVQQLQNQQQRVMNKIDKLKKMATCQQQKVDEIKEWAEIVIDKSNRRAVEKTIKEKHRFLEMMKQKNNQLQIYLCQLENQEEVLLRQKENSHLFVRSPAKSNKHIGSKSRLKNKKR